MQEVRANKFQEIGHILTRFMANVRLVNTTYSPLDIKKSRDLKVKELEDKFNQICAELEQLDNLEPKLRDYLSQVEHLNPRMLAKHKHIQDNIQDKSDKVLKKYDSQALATCIIAAIGAILAFPTCIGSCICIGAAGMVINKLNKSADNSLAEISSQEWGNMAGNIQEKFKIASTAR